MAAYKNEDLYNTLKELQIIDEALLKKGYEESETKKLPLDEFLSRENLIPEDDLGKLVADLLNVPFINLSEVSIPEDVLSIIPKAVAKAQRTIAYKLDDKGLHIATQYPENKPFFDMLAVKTLSPVNVHYTLFSHINRSLALYSKNISQAFEDIIDENVRQAKGDKNAEPPIIKIVDTIINYAYQNNASDIHIEPLDESTLVRFRMDGVLHDIVNLPVDLAPQIVIRIKVMANLRTDEHQTAQDGKITFKVDAGSESENLDVRVSIAPITKGEKIVMRLLSEHARQISLTDLGIANEDLKKVTEAYHMPHGMILATGPTGSGKTTSLYAILKLINKREINIMTIEDPVEYQIENINQIQVNAKTGLTFAKGLRSIVRQDPDAILVGEIRDAETADIAVNSAMTGHLVLSSLHTNDSVTAFPRLMDMGVEPYLIAATVNVIMAQRLVRRICTKCRVSVEIPYANLDSQIQKMVPKSKKLLAYHGKGCNVCHNTGYTGRVGIFEVLLMTEELSQAVTAKSTIGELKKIAKKSGMKTMMEDGIEKVKQGMTTVEELLRVTKE